MRPNATATYASASSARSRVAAAEMSRLREKLRRPIQLVLLALAITLVDLAATAVKGELFFIGPVRPLWVAGPLALLAVALAFWRVFVRTDDD